MKRIIVGLVSLASLGWAYRVHGSPLPQLTSYFEMRVATAQRAMQNGPAPSSGVDLTDYNIDFVAQAGFGLSEVFQVTLYPELDLVFVPTNPSPEPSVAASPQRP